MLDVAENAPVVRLCGLAGAPLPAVAVYDSQARKVYPFRGPDRLTPAVLERFLAAYLAGSLAATAPRDEL